MMRNTLLKLVISGLVSTPAFAAPFSEKRANTGESAMTRNSVILWVVILLICSSAWFCKQCFIRGRRSYYAQMLSGPWSYPRTKRRLEVERIPKVEPPPRQTPLPRADVDTIKDAKFTLSSGSDTVSVARKSISADPRPISTFSQVTQLLGPTSKLVAFLNIAQRKPFTFLRREICTADGMLIGLLGSPDVEIRAQIQMQRTTCRTKVRSIVDPEPLQNSPKDVRVLPTIRLVSDVIETPLQHDVNGGTVLDNIRPTSIHSTTTSQSSFICSISVHSALSNRTIKQESIFSLGDPTSSVSLRELASTPIPSSPSSSRSSLPESPSQFFTSNQAWLDLIDMIDESNSSDMSSAPLDSSHAIQYDLTSLSTAYSPDDTDVFDAAGEEHQLRMYHDDAYALNTIEEIPSEEVVATLELDKIVAALNFRSDDGGITPPAPAYSMPLPHLLGRAQARQRSRRSLYAARARPSQAGPSPLRAMILPSVSRSPSLGSAISHDNLRPSSQVDAFSSNSHAFKDADGCSSLDAFGAPILPENPSQEQMNTSEEHIQSIRQGHAKSYSTDGSPDSLLALIQELETGIQVRGGSLRASRSLDDGHLRRRRASYPDVLSSAEMFASTKEASEKFFALLSECGDNN